MEILEGELRGRREVQPDGGAYQEELHNKIKVQEAAKLRRKPPQQRLAKAEHVITAAEKLQDLLEGRQRDVATKMEDLAARRCERADRHSARGHHANG